MWRNLRCFASLFLIPSVSALFNFQKICGFAKTILFISCILLFFKCFFDIFYLLLAYNIIWLFRGYLKQFEPLWSSRSGGETGLPTKDATSTTTVESACSHFNKFCGLQQVTDCIFMPNIFINVYKGQTKSKDPTHL